MKHLTVVLWALLVTVILESLVSVPRYFDPELPLSYSRDLLVLVGLLIVVARTRLARPVWFLAVAGWGLALGFEWIRGVGTTAMSQQPLLYDAYFLVGHLYILLRDLMGMRALVAFVAVGVSLVVLVMLSAWMFRKVQASARGASTVGVIVALCGLVAFGITGEQFGEAKGRNSLMDLVDNLDRSYAVSTTISQTLAPNAYADIRNVELERKPSVHIYIVESYGRGMRRESIRADYYSLLKGLRTRFQTAGWSMMTGLSEAPVMGGRSWLADATLLSGRTVKYESVYRHITPKLKDLATLPGFFNDQGYQTVLMRPKDKARAGVELVNHFGFDHTVFSLDLAYQGRPYGWVEIPDQYALGHIRDEVLPALGPEPVFVFAHLGTSHIPWDEVPPILDDWRAFNEYEGRIPRTNGRPLDEKNIRFQMNRYKRKDEVRLRRLKPTSNNVEDFFKSVSYSLEVVAQHVESLTDPPDMVIIMGDHQPPMYKNNPDFTVPVHVLVRDHKLLREFRNRKFRSGMKPPKWEKRIYHEGFFSLMVRALSRADGVEPPRYRKRGEPSAKSENTK